jgi:hypothetical protein
MHWKSHLLPSQLAWLAPGGTGQGSQEVPQAFTLVDEGHWP